MTEITEDQLQFMQDICDKPTSELRELAENTGDSQQREIIELLIKSRHNASNKAMDYEIKKFEITEVQFYMHLKIKGGKVDRTFPELNLRFEFDGQPWEDKIKLAETELRQLEATPPLPLDTPEAAEETDLELQHEVYSKQVEATKKNLEDEKKELKEQREKNQNYEITVTVKNIKYLENSTEMVVKLDADTFFALLEKYRAGLPYWSNLIINKA